MDYSYLRQVWLQQFQPFWFYRANKQTERITDAVKRLTPATVVGVSNNSNNNNNNNNIQTDKFIWYRINRYIQKLLTMLSAMSSQHLSCQSSSNEDLQIAADLSPQTAVRAPLLSIYSSVRSVRSADAAVDRTRPLRPASHTNARREQ